MYDVPKWKLGFVAALVLIAALYALPNAFPSQPAVQISANRGAVVDAALQGRVEGALKGHEIEFAKLERTDDRLLVRFNDNDTQTQASDVLLRELGDRYTVALNLATTVPAWMQAIYAKPLSLGLDLRGGVHFLMEVDQEAAREKMEERYVSDLYQLMRSQQIAYRAVTRNREGLLIQLVSAEDRSKALSVISRDAPDLIIDEVPSADNFLLLAKIRPEKVVESQKHTIDQNITTLRNRVNELGVAEPVILQQGSTRIVVQLPGVQDTAVAKKILGSTATLEYRAGNDTANAFEAEQTGRVPPDSRLYKDQNGQPVLLKKDIIATGDQLIGATSGFDQQTGTPMVAVRLDSAGGRRMLDFTSENVGRPMGVVYIERVPDDKVVDGVVQRSFRETQTVISVANIRGVFSTNFQTTGLGSSQEAAELALLLRAGSLAVPVDIIEERIIGPSLGKDNIERGLRATLIGFIAIVIFMMIYYRTVGVVAVLGLVVNLFLLLAILSALGATLTMPGIAGVVLTLGMAVDANVLIAERIREEIRSGNSPMTSLQAGYEKAWATILDANLTTMFAAMALLAFGTGPVRGFAITLMAGLITSMFSAVVVTRMILSVYYGRQRKVAAISI